VESARCAGSARRSTPGRAASKRGSTIGGRGGGWPPATNPGSDRVNAGTLAGRTSATSRVTRSSVLVPTLALEGQREGLTPSFSKEAVRSKLSGTLKRYVLSAFVLFLLNLRASSSRLQSSHDDGFHELGKWWASADCSPAPTGRRRLQRAGALGASGRGRSRRRPALSKSESGEEAGDAVGIGVVEGRSRAGSAFFQSSMSPVSILRRATLFARTAESPSRSIGR